MLILTLWALAQVPADAPCSYRRAGTDAEQPIRASSRDSPGRPRRFTFIAGLATPCCRHRHWRPPVSVDRTEQPNSKAGAPASGYRRRRASKVISGLPVRKEGRAGGQSALAAAIALAGRVRDIRRAGASHRAATHRRREAGTESP